ncbi:transmembrane oligosaccharyl transferase [Halosimplex carlsbadense 2-9-1]|uniref:dolichyl-phosphooligosaccharide-protein glycotransferase n=1 Tax=Halosimplex carlsbadense 2-9-1 TaxID=797114 RepID=M0CNX7_9EURY|nr:oligosaccharyl transferase, archaeosortase A system-associated [Halosimplex carlsbadense]ELZ24092.1 transmembrane oligosaccharyl transferase [Halosimplex carlsbadense 2-9-1]
MSQWRGQIENIDEPGDVADLVGEYYHIPAIVALLGFMLWSRVRDWQEFLIDGTVFFSGNDPWYHYRMVQYTVQHWPETSPFDPWTQFPVGTHSSQFGTVMDQLVATAALVVGLGNPSDHTVRLVVLFAPAVFGTLVAIPTYFLAKRLAGKFAGVLAVAVIALAGSTLAQRGTVGFYDHHVAEALFMTTAVLATMVAVSVAEQEKPVWELFRARDVTALRRPVGWSLIAGAAIAIYLWTWAPGVFLVGILGVFFLVEICSEYAHGESPEHVAIAGALTLSTAGVLSLAVTEEVGLSATSYNLVQPMLAFGVAAGCVFLAWFAREWESRDLANYQFPLAVGSILVVSAGAIALLLPELWGFLTNQITRVVGLSVTDTAQTVGEAQSMSFGELFPRYGFTVFIALLGVAYVAVRQFYDRPRAELTLVSVWTVFLLLATLTQQRFDYYLAIAVATMAAMVLGELARLSGLSTPDTDIETYQLLTMAAVVLVVFAPLVYPVPLAMQTTSAPGGPGPAQPAWNETLGWMQNNAPEQGTYGGADNAGEVPYYGTFENTENFDYPEGYYGTLSWWDYGHWLTVMGEQMPTANPFQQGASQAANFLLSTNESHANEVMTDLSEDDAQSRFVTVDWKMAETTTSYQRAGAGPLRVGGKYFAPFAFYSDGNISRNDYYSGLYYQTGQQDRVQYRLFQRHQQPYYNSTAVRLYRFHGSARDPAPVVLDWTIEDIQGQQVPISNGTRRFGSMAEAREYVETDPTSQIGGFGNYPEERVPALEHYRMVQGSDSSSIDSRRYQLGLQKQAQGAFQTSIRQPGVLGALQPASSNWVKAFERVPGGTIEGEGPANTTVTAAVEMQVPSTNSTFVYRQEARTGDDGTFTMTVPYSTTGYDEWTNEEGYTEPSVTANSSYRLRTDLTSNGTHTFRYGGTVDVTEGQVVGEDESAATVTLEKGQARSLQTEQGDDTAGNETAGDGTANDDTTNETGTDDASGDTSTPDGATATATPTDTGTATATDTATATGSDGTANGSTGSALVDPSAPATLLGLLGGGVLSAVGLTRRD